jgi:hypothetical protein
MSETEILRHIRTAYGAMIAEAAARHGHRPEVMAGIAMRESGGRPDAISADGHDHGLFQINDRVYPEFCAGENWRDPLKNADIAATALRQVRAIVELECAKFNVAGDRERMAISGYNCGAALAVHNQRHYGDPDKGTTGGDYSAAVLRYAELYLNLED